MTLEVEKEENKIYVGYKPKTKRKVVDLDNGIPNPDTNNVLITWTNRRWMAWISIAINIMLVMLVLFVIPLNVLEKLESILTTIMWVNVAIIVSYMAFSSLPFWGIFKNKE